MVLQNTGKYRAERDQRDRDDTGKRDAGSSSGPRSVTQRNKLFIIFSGYRT